MNILYLLLKLTQKAGKYVCVDRLALSLFDYHPEMSRNTDKLLCHELLHDIIMHLGGSKKGAKLYRQLVNQALKNMSEEQQKAIIAKYKEAGETRAAVHLEEIVAHYGEVFANQSFFEAMINERPSLAKRILNFFKSCVTHYAGDERLTKSALKFQRTFKKLFGEYSRVNQNTNAYEQNLTASEGEKRSAIELDSNGNLEYNEVERKKSSAKRFTKEDKAVLHSEVMRKNSSGKAHFPIDFSYTANHFVVYENFGEDSFKIISALDIDINKDVIDFIKDGIKNGSIYGNTSTVRAIISKVRASSRRNRSNNDYLAYTGRNGVDGGLHRSSSGLKNNDGQTVGRSGQNQSNVRNAIPDFDIAKGSISKNNSEEVDSKLKEIKKLAKSAPSALLATQIQFTNQQAGIEAAGKALGMKDIEAEVQAVRASRNQTQEMLAGNQWTIMGDKVVKTGEGFYKIIEPMKAKGKEYFEAFQQFLFHRHNIDRMSLEERSIAQNEANEQELQKMEARLAEIKSELSEINAKLKDLKLNKGREAILERGRLNELKNALSAERSALVKNSAKLRHKTKNFKIEANKPVFAKEENGEKIAVNAEESRKIVTRQSRFLMALPCEFLCQYKIKGYVYSSFEYFSSHSSFKTPVKYTVYPIKNNVETVIITLNQGTDEVITVTAVSLTSLSIF